MRGNVSSGYGMWRSVDAGKTWTASGVPKSRHMTRIAITPTTHKIVFAGVMGKLNKPNDDRGIDQSMKGGKTWEKEL